MSSPVRSAVLATQARISPAHTGTRISVLAVALYLLIWGEAGNLRFCPEFLAWLYHKMARELVRVMQGKDVGARVFQTYLGDVIRPAYEMLASEVSVCARRSGRSVVVGGRFLRATVSCVVRVSSVATYTA
jgi:1,3-beta-glucan synthase subunit FKS1, domain-1